jgi:hypothetical protein
VVARSICSCHPVFLLVKFPPEEEEKKSGGEEPAPSLPCDNNKALLLLLLCAATESPKVVCRPSEPPVGEQKGDCRKEGTRPLVSLSGLACKSGNLLVFFKKV